MSEKDISMKADHETRDEAELSMLENQAETDEEVIVLEDVEARRRVPAWAIALAVIGLTVVLTLAFIWSKRSGPDETKVAVKTETTDESPAHGPGEVKLDPEMLESAGIEIEGVTQRPAIALLRTTGAIETNPQQTQSVSSLVGGRVETMNVRVGDRVSQGAILASISSNEISEMQGKLREAKIRFENAERSLARVQRSENRAAVLQAKARLDETEATLKRTRRLMELGAGAGKDLVSAETNYKTAKADYDFQSNIALNKELQEARAEMETARVEVAHMRDQLRALGAAPNEGTSRSENISRIPVRAPASGMITDRPVNPGAGVQAGTTLFVISDLASVYAIANVPEAQMPNIRVGTIAEVTSPALGERPINARVAYIDPQLNEDTRTGRVRLEVPNPNNVLRAGMFVEVGFQTGTGESTGEELVVPAIAIQRIGDKTVVFLPKENEPGTFEVREVQTGGEVEEYTRILGGLKLGEKVVTKGSFTLKTQLQKGELGEE
jgi:cobalt-zinc-cadmium efflux system membrane fusion protein